jgi:hypothetical protein
LQLTPSKEKELFYEIHDDERSFSFLVHVL